MLSRISLIVGSAACAAAVGVPSADAATFAFDGNLVQHHTFDTDVSDAFGRSSTAVGGVSIDGGNSIVGGGSLALNGSGSIDLGVNAALNGLTQSTVSLWVKIDTPHVDIPISAIFTNDGFDADAIHLNFGDLINDSGGQQLDGQVGYMATSPLGTWPVQAVGTAGDWVHLAVVNDGGNVSFYLNGSLADTDTGASLLRYGDDATLGSWSNQARTWIGNMDDFRIYDIALSPEQVGEIHAVPEPASLALLGLGALVMFKRNRG